MIDITIIEEFFLSLPLKKLNRCAQVCKQWQQFLMKHPEVFWFKHQTKLKNYIRPCSCIFNQLFWLFYCNGNGAIISFRPSSDGRFTYDPDKIKLPKRYNLFYLK